MSVPQPPTGAQKPFGQTGCACLGCAGAIIGLILALAAGDKKPEPQSVTPPAAQVQQQALSAQQAAPVQQQAPPAQQAAPVQQAVSQNDWVWYATSGEGRRYHRQNCRTLRGASQYCTRAQAQAVGYTACQVCNP